MHAQLSLWQRLHCFQSPAPSACVKIPMPGPHSDLEVPNLGAPAPEPALQHAQWGLGTADLRAVPPRSQAGRPGQPRAEGSRGEDPGQRRAVRGPGRRGGACCQGNEGPVLIFTNP